MLKISIRGGEQLIAALRRKGPQIAMTLAGRLNRLLIQLSSYIVSQKLSGQVLHRRSGVLSGSVRALPVEMAGGTIRGSVEAGAGPAGLYAGVHEFGGNHSYMITSVKGRALRFMIGNKESFAKSVMHKPAQVRAYMSPSLAEKSAEIRASLQEALDAEINSD
jgi:hypothetical protein